MEKQNHYVVNKYGKAVHKLKNNGFKEVCKVSNIYSNMHEYKFAHVNIGSELDVKYSKETHRTLIIRIKNFIKKIWKI